VFFEIRGEVADVETLAIGKAIRELRKAELHWYEAHGIGKKEFDPHFSPGSVARRARLSGRRRT
jgi:hypothetical protein